MLMVIYANLGECMMKRRKTGTAQVKVKMDANGRLVQIGGDREVVKAKRGITAPWGAVWRSVSYYCVIARE